MAVARGRNRRDRFGRDGRKDFVASAMFTADLKLVAESRATWIALKSS